MRTDRRDGPRRFIAGVAALVAISASTTPAAAQGSASCRQARQTVAEVARLYASPAADLAALLHRLTTARDLCPAYGEAWKLSACIARDLGQDSKARLYTDRAVFNGISELSCDGAARPTPAADLGPVRDKYALVVGIREFADPAIKDLQYSDKDARDFYEYLIDQKGGRFDPRNVKLLVNDGATRAAILVGLNDIILQAQEQDLVVVYISSHGSPAVESAGLQGVGYIVTHDTVWENVFVDSLEFQDFSEKVSRIKARRKVTFLDTCYSGQAMRRGEKNLGITTLGVSDDTAKLFTSVEGSFLITSSAPSEKSWESDGLQNSYFTYYLLEALRRDEEPPALRDVFADLTRQVAAAVRSEKAAKQTPQLHPRDLPADLRIGAPSIASAGPSGSALR